VAAVSVRVICASTVLDASQPPPSVGARVVIWAKPEFNAAKGSFALAAAEIRAVGLGELLARLERLRVALAAEGLFASERKRPLPFLPHKVGLICGRDSAAERDVLQNAARRWPAVQFRVEEVAVQGAHASEEIIEALQRLDSDKTVEVIIIARGGGSVEDLLPFSNEDLVRAVAGCATPVVSAIGHEQDVPLLDLVADVRASTPTDAARRTVPDVTEQFELISQLRARARRALAGRLDRDTSWLTAIRSRPVLASPQREIDRREEQVLGLAERVQLAMKASIERHASDVAHIKARLIALSPAATLRRGYAIVQEQDARVVMTAAQVSDGDVLTIRLASDQLQATAGIRSDGD